MRHLGIVAVAGIMLAFSGTANSSLAQEEGKCPGANCFVEISVVDDQVVATPDVLTVTADTTNIHFRVVSDGYRFIDDPNLAIEFKEGSKEPAGKRFSGPSVGGPQEIVLVDNNRQHVAETFMYTVRIMTDNGDQLEPLDPEIRNR